MVVPSEGKVLNNVRRSRELNKERMHRKVVAALPFYRRTLQSRPKADPDLPSEGEGQKRPMRLKTKNKKRKKKRDEKKEEEKSVWEPHRT